MPPLTPHSEPRHDPPMLWRPACLGHRSRVYVSKGTRYTALEGSRKIVIALESDGPALMYPNRIGSGSVYLFSGDEADALNGTGEVLCVEVETGLWAVLLQGTLNSGYSAGGFSTCTPPLRSAAGLLADLVRVRPPRWQPIHDGILAVIATETVSALRHRKEQERRFSEGVARSIRFMEQNLDEMLQLEDLAKVSGWSAYHFARRFRAETGETPKRYLRRLRLDRAKRLLSETDRDLTNVAFECGFCSQSALTTNFRLRFGTTPARYRLLIRTSPAVGEVGNH